MDRKIVELLMGGAGVKQIARNLHVSKTRIRVLREKAKEYGYLTEEGSGGAVALPPYPMAVFPDPVDKRSLKVSPPHQLLEPHRAWIEDRLRAGWHAVTVFEELPVQGIGRSSFYRYLEGHKLNRLGEEYRGAIPEIIHQPGEALLVDWGKLCDGIDPVTGRKRTVWTFTGILGYSRYLMVRLVWTNDTVTTLRVLEDMFKELGGVPFKVTSDNPKCFALEASKYDPILNPAFERFAAHYGFIIECLPPCDPEKKGKIERPIPYVRRLYEAHGDIWHGIEEAQAYMEKKLAIANERQHGTTLRRPREVFEQEEKSRLKELPALAYEIEQYQEGIVRKDGHVRFANKYYSVDEVYKDKTVSVMGDSKTVSIYYKGKLLEVHDRITHPNKSKSTKPQHLKPWERAMQDDSLYRQRAAQLGPSVDAMVLALLKQGQGFIDTRKIWGILTLDKSFTSDKINAACERALKLGVLSSRAVRNLLEAEENLKVAVAGAAPIQKTPKGEHKFVHPLSEYEEQMSLFVHETKSEGGNHEPGSREVAVKVVEALDGSEGA